MIFDWLYAVMRVVVCAFFFFSNLSWRKQSGTWLSRELDKFSLDAPVFPVRFARVYYLHRACRVQDPLHWAKSASLSRGQQKRGGTFWVHSESEQRQVQRDRVQGQGHAP